MVVDYAGIFEKPERALAFDSKDISRGLLDIEVLKERFKELMQQAKETLSQVNIEDEKARIANIIDYFFDEDRRSVFVKLFNQIQEIYEILSPDEFLRDYLKDYRLLIQVYQVIYKEFSLEAERKRAHRDILRKTEKLIKESVELRSIADSLPIYEINKDIASLIKADKLSERVKVVNLHRSLVSYVEQNKEKQPFLLLLSEEVGEIIKELRERQRSIESALNDLTRLAQEIASLRKEQEKSGLSKEEFSIFQALKGYKVNGPEEMARRTYRELERRSEWFYSEGAEREVRTELYKLLSGELREVSSIKSGEETPVWVIHTADLVNKVLRVHRILASRGE
jgi:type I restriction enzyme R subunit